MSRKAEVAVILILGRGRQGCFSTLEVNIKVILLILGIIGELRT